MAAYPLVWAVNRPSAAWLAGAIYDLALRCNGIAINYPGRDGLTVAEERFLGRIAAEIKGGVVFDVGANVGAYSQALLRLAPGAEIHAFEPHPSTFRRLAKRLAGEEVSQHLGDRQDPRGPAPDEALALRRQPSPGEPPETRPFLGQWCVHLQQQGQATLRRHQRAGRVEQIRSLIDYIGREAPRRARQPPGGGQRIGHLGQFSRPARQMRPNPAQPAARAAQPGSGKARWPHHLNGMALGAQRRDHRLKMHRLAIARADAVAIEDFHARIPSVGWSIRRSRRLPRAAPWRASSSMPAGCQGSVTITPMRCRRSVSLTAELGIEWQVEFLGLAERHAVPGLIAGFDVALQPAAVPYACPLKLLEYMAAGRAIVAPDQPNLRELLQHDSTALLFAPGDAAAQWRAIATLAADAPLRRRLGDAARRDVILRDMTWAGQARRVVALAEAAMAEQRARRRHQEAGYAEPMG